MKLLKITILFTISLVLGCNRVVEVNQVEEKLNKTNSITDLTYMEPFIFEDLEVSDSLKINFSMGNIKRSLTYQQDNPLNLPDGTILKKGDLKPIWQFISKRVGIDIVDVTNQSQSASDLINEAELDNYSNATIYGGNSQASNLMNSGAQGKFINLKDYLEYLPHLTQYLNENPEIAKAITAYDGGIYHLPYVAEINNYARILNTRSEWITSLLDSMDNLIEEDETLQISYNGFWERYPTNIITLQNNVGRNGLLDRDSALKVLLEYIKRYYPTLTKPSDLYIGSNPQYDMDELIALWRVIKLSPNTLSKVSTGSVVPNSIIHPYFARKTSYREEVFRLLTFLDGERVHASDATTSAIFYVGNDGDLIYSYSDPIFLKKLSYLKEWYSEGLIFTDFHDLSNKSDIRKNLFFSDNNDGQQEFGFMTMDWIASTTAGSDKISGILPPVTTISKAGITNFIHYMENTRSIKPDGWSISTTSSEPEINAALKLMDYFFSEEGNKIQNYSTPDTWLEGEVYTAPNGEVYPKLNNWILNNTKELKNGDISSFLTEYMGARLAIGYQKTIGLELQATTKNGENAWDLYSDKNVLTMTYDSPITYLKLMPPIISLTSSDLIELNDTSIGGSIRQKMFDFIIGSDKDLNSYKDLIKLYDENGIQKYKDIYEKAYYRMMEPK